MKKIISILLSALLLLNLTSAFAMAQTQEPASIYTEAKTKDVSAGEDFEFEIYLSGTYDGYAINVSSYSGTEIKNVVPADRTIKADKKTDAWVISTMPGLEYVDSEKMLIATVTVSTSDSAAGELSLSLAKVNLTNEAGDRIDDYGSHIGTIVIKAKPIAVTDIALDKTTATVETGDETLILTPIFSPENATNKNLTWASDNESVATVEDGVVTLVKKGVATITATTEDGGYTASCIVTVNCSHKKVNSYSAESSTCIKQGHEAYDVCEDCGEIINGSDAKLPLSTHTYDENVNEQYLKTEATCNSYAVYYKSCAVCGEKGNETFEYGDFDMNNHIGDTYIENSKDATCYENGYTGDVCCVGCNTVLESGAVIEKNAHTESAWIETTAPTCTADGEKQTVCTVCGTVIKTEAVPATGHSFGAWTVTKAATCTSKGVETRTCSCGETETREIAMKAHTAGNWEEKTAPTCTDKGTEVQKCTVCGVELNTRETAAKGHTYGEWIVVTEATCTEKGEKKAVCSTCGEAVTEEISAKGHTASGWEETIAPTCTADGEKQIVCTVCDTVIKTEAISALGHNVGKYEIVKEATCTASGEKKAVCTVCGEEYTEVISALGHNFGEWTVTKEATETAEGEKVRECSVCGEKEVSVIPVLEAQPTEAETEADTDKNTVTNPEIPNTSNNEAIYIITTIFAVMALSAAAGTILTKKRKCK